MDLVYRRGVVGDLWRDEGDFWWRLRADSDVIGCGGGVFVVDRSPGGGRARAGGCRAARAGVASVRREGGAGRVGPQCVRSGAGGGARTGGVKAGVGCPLCRSRCSRICLMTAGSRLWPPASLYLLHPWSRRLWPLTAMDGGNAGDCQEQSLPASLYLPHPWSRTSSIPGVVPRPSLDSPGLHFVAPGTTVLLAQAGAIWGRSLLTDRRDNRPWRRSRRRRIRPAASLWPGNSGEPWF